MENKEYYVYLHKKLNGEVFYVGKGKGRRAFKNNRRSTLWNYTKDKYGLQIEIYEDNLSESEALSLEMELIKQFGRIDIGTGCLVNFTDGGDTTNLSPIARKKISEKQKERYSNPEEKEKLVERLTGRESKRKLNPYLILGKESGEILEGYLSDLISVLGNGSRQRLLNLISGRIKSTGGWVLNPEKEKFEEIKNNRKDKRIYDFISLNNSFSGTKAEFTSFIGIKTSPLFVGIGRKRIVKGWAVVRDGESREHVLDMLHEGCTPRYFFFNDEKSKYFIGTSKEFSKEFNIKFSSLSDMFRKSNPRKVHGWYIKEKI